MGGCISKEETANSQAGDEIQYHELIEMESEGKLQIFKNFFMYG